MRIRNALSNCLGSGSCDVMQASQKLHGCIFRLCALFHNEWGMWVLELTADAFVADRGTGGVG